MMEIIQKFQPVILSIMGIAGAAAGFWIHFMISQPLKELREEVKELRTDHGKVEEQLFNIWKDKADGPETKARLLELERRLYDQAARKKGGD